MTEEHAVLTNVTLVPPHCSVRTPSGRRCRMAVADPKSGLCFRHAAVRIKESSGDFSEALVCGIKEFHSAVDINHVLGRGAVMAYTCSLLLRTLPAIEDELEPEEPQFVFDLPDPPNPEPALFEKVAAPCVTTPVEPDGYDGHTSEMDKSK